MFRIFFLLYLNMQFIMKFYHLQSLVTELLIFRWWFSIFELKVISYELISLRENFTKHDRKIEWSPCVSDRLHRSRVYVDTIVCTTKWRADISNFPARDSTPAVSSYRIRLPAIPGCPKFVGLPRNVTKFHRDSWTRLGLVRFGSTRRWWRGIVSSTLLFAEAFVYNIIYTF